MKEKDLNWLKTGNYLIVVCGSNAPITLEKGTEKYKKVEKLLESGAAKIEIERALDLVRGIEEFSDGKIRVDRDTNEVFIDNQKVVGCIVKRIISFVQSNKPYEPLVNFWRNVQKNPSEDSKRDLYAFLEANKMTITEDGHFLAYKKVTKKNGKLVDCRTKTISNEIGEIVSMSRDEVDLDRNHTCSTGLHVAAYEYAQHKYVGTVLLQVKVHPADVVAVPPDYNNQKMRTCRYKVVGIVGNKIDSDKIPLVDKSTEKSITKHSKKINSISNKTEKKKIRETETLKHANLLESYRTSGKLLIASGIEGLGFTAKEIISIVCAYVPAVKTGELRTMDLKNKKSIVNKAVKLLEGHFDMKIKRLP